MPGGLGQSARPAVSSCREGMQLGRWTMGASVMLVAALLLVFWGFQLYHPAAQSASSVVDYELYTAMHVFPPVLERPGVVRGGARQCSGYPRINLLDINRRVRFTYAAKPIPEPALPTSVLAQLVVEYTTDSEITGVMCVRSNRGRQPKNLSRDSCERYSSASQDPR